MRSPIPPGPRTPSCRRKPRSSVSPGPSLLGSVMPAMELHSLVATSGTSTDVLSICRARLELVSKLCGKISFRPMPDLAGASSTLLGPRPCWNLSLAVRVQNGKVTIPVGPQREQGREHDQFGELGDPTAPVPRRDHSVLGVDGESATFQGVEPRRPISDERKMGGAWQLAARARSRF